MGSEIRQNKATGEWVIFAPSRGRRPHDFAQPPADSGPSAVWEARCPFCPGNEAMLPAILWASAGQGENPWQTRIVLNKYPALEPGGTFTRLPNGIYVAMEGYGHHEVIVEHPQHNRDIASMGQSEVCAIIETYHRRYMELCENEQNAMILVFRNHGLRAGASLQHPHSQIITTGIFPRHIRWRNEEAQRHFDEWGRCIYCDILAYESREGERVILENDSFLAFIPFAAEVPFETWIVPKRHQADFGQISDVEQADLAAALRSILGSLAARLHDPAYNYVINSSVHHEHERHLHWHLSIRPRLVTRAGFEIGTGIRINPSLPELDARFLRSGDAEPYADSSVAPAPRPASAPAVATDASTEAAPSQRVGLSLDNGQFGDVSFGAVSGRDHIETGAIDNRTGSFISPGQSHISGVTGSIVNVGSSLSEVKQQVGGAPAGAEGGGSRVAKLLSLFERELRRAPERLVAEADDAAEIARLLVDQATATRPNQILVQHSAAALEQAARTLVGELPAAHRVAVMLAEAAQRRG